jgi:hypothetical protein
LRVLTRQELTVALAARQGLIERWRVTPAQAIRRLTPLQAQYAPAPFIGLAARLEYDRADLERAIDAREVVKTTIMRQTLHLAAAEDYPAYAEFTRRTRLRTLRRTYPLLDEEKLTRELTEWFAEPRTNLEIRRYMTRYDLPQDPNTPVLMARTLLPLVQLPPAGHYRDSGRGARFVLAELRDAAAHVVTRYLEAFGPAAKRDISAWAGVAQSDFTIDIETVSYRDEKGRELLDLPGRPLPPADTPLPPRFVGRWDQALLAYADRDRIIPPELLPLQLTLSGAQTVLVDGRVAASWTVEDGRIEVTPHTGFPRQAVREEARRTARFLSAGA